MTEEPEFMFKAKCPECGYAINGSAKSSGSLSMPRDGAVGLCINCLEPAVFMVNAFGLTLRRCSSAERAALFADPSFIEVRDHLRLNWTEPERRAAELLARGANVGLATVVDGPEGERLAAAFGGRKVSCALCGREAWLVNPPPEHIGPDIVCPACARDNDPTDLPPEASRG